MYWLVEVVTEDGIEEISKQRQENLAYFSINDYLKSLSIKPTIREEVSIDDNKKKIIFRRDFDGYFYITKMQGWMYVEEDKSLTIYDEDNKPEFKGFIHKKWCNLPYSSKFKKREKEKEILKNDNLYFYVDKNLNVKSKVYKGDMIDGINRNLNNIYMNSGDIKYEDIKKWKKHYDKKKRY